MSQTRPGELIAQRRLWTGLGQSIGAAAAATVIVLIAAAALGKDPLAMLGALAAGPLGDADRFADALGRACPLMLCGLAVAVAFRCQAWNIGAEGQFVLGAIVVGAMGTRLDAWPGWLLLPTMLLAAAVAGGLFAIPAALLENHRNVPLVLSTILLNFVAISLVTYLTQGPLRGGDPSAA
ncbi:MAG: ABC transporter permease, partial [Planctomycetes bacterium]|nr:ABC transporter permease [Planctomycetota bacterium]